MRRVTYRGTGLRCRPGPGGHSKLNAGGKALRTESRLQKAVFTKRTHLCMTGECAKCLTQKNIRQKIPRRPIPNVAPPPPARTHFATSRRTQPTPFCLVASLPRCLVASLPRCLVASLPCCLVAIRRGDPAPCSYRRTSRSARGVRWRRGGLWRPRAED